MKEIKNYYAVWGMYLESEEVYGTDKMYDVYHLALFKDLKTAQDFKEKITYVETYFKYFYEMIDKACELLLAGYDKYATIEKLKEYMGNDSDYCCEESHDNFWGFSVDRMTFYDNIILENE